jgi:uncharacterized repeat protein (TIGR01451 family)
VSGIGLANNGGSVTTDGTTVTYTPRLNYHGTDVFTYTVSDSHGGFDLASVTVTVTAVNGPPVANAGDDQTVNTNATVMLDGSGSYDPEDNEPLTYGWQQTGGLEVSFNSALSVTTFTAPSTATVLTFTLMVTNSLGLAALTPDEVVITVSLLQADLTLSKTDNQITATAGSLITYTIVVTNNGPSAVIGASVVDVLPANLTDVNWTCTATASSSCTASGSVSLSDSLVNLLNGGRATIMTGRVVPTATGTLSNTATVTVPSGTTDPVSNNSATDTTEIVSPPGPGSHRIYLPLIRR